ncbi:MAG TPA: sigma factor-like helix-turn-helix DNA-binding protein, partial [Cyclobacteriaceae bacterium]
ERLSETHMQIADTVSENKEEQIARMYQAIGKLSPLNRAIVMLYLDDLRYEEIASVTGLTKTNVGVRLVRIKSELEKEMKLTEEN